MAEAKDSYTILGVKPNASMDEIRRAFRRIVKDNHPDTHKGDKACEARFKEAKEAFEKLETPEKRKAYDAARLRPVSSPIRSVPTTMPMPPRVRQPRPRPSQTSGSTPIRIPSRPAVVSKAETAKRLREVLASIEKQSYGNLHQGDAVSVGGALYVYRRFLYKKPGDTRTFRSWDSVLCRTKGVLALDRHPILNRDQHPARSEEITLFLRDSDRILAEFAHLWKVRRSAATVAADLSQFLKVGDPPLKGSPGRYRMLNILFQRSGKRFSKVVLCTGKEILSHVNGDPVSTEYKFATRNTARSFALAHSGLRSQAVLIAKTRNQKAL